MAKQPFLEIDLGENGGAYKFFSLDECKDWVRKERAAWEWLVDLRDPDTHNPSAYVKSHRDTLRSIDSALNECGPDSKTDPDAAKRNLKSNLEGPYANGRLIHSTSRHGRFLEGLKDESPALAAHALSGILKMNFPRNHPAQLEGLFRLFLFDYGIKNTAQTEKKALDALHRESQEELIAARSERQTFGDEMSKLQEAASEHESARQKTFDDHMADTKAKTEQLFEKTTEKCELVKKTYSEELALHESVVYWQKKEALHGAQFVGWAKKTGLAVGLVTVLLSITTYCLIGIDTLEHVQVWRIGILAIVATVGVWTLRVLVRLMLSNAHLRADAEERATMLLTYLALVQEGKLDEKQRKLILQSLFRPASTGLIKDDAAPPMMAQWLKMTTGDN